MKDKILNNEEEEELFSKLFSSSPYSKGPSEVSSLDLPNRLILIHNDLVTSSGTRYIYIVNGSLFHIDDNKIYEAGSYFVANKDSGCSITYCLEESEVVISSKESEFYDPFRKRIHTQLEILKKIEEHDPYTYEHLTRVCFLAIKTASILDIDGFELATLIYALRFFDIGKILIPKSILNKRGELSPKEKSCIKGHVYPDLSEVKEFRNRDVEELILQHHERFDGSGYPNKLKEHEILLGAQIIGICDTYDAMTNDRPYRDALSEEDAIKEIKKLSDVKFSKKVVDSFLGAYNRSYKEILLDKCSKQDQEFN